MNRPKTTDAIVAKYTSAEGVEVINTPDPRNLSLDSEAALVRDNLYMTGVVKSMNKEEEKHWTQKDSHGYAPWIVEFVNGTSQYAGYMLSMMEQTPGSRWEPNGAGGVKFVAPVTAPDPPALPPSGSQQANPGATDFHINPTTPSAFETQVRLDLASIRGDLAAIRSRFGV